MPTWARDLPLSQVTQTPILPCLEHLQVWGIHSLSEQPVPVPLCPYRNKFLLIPHPNLLQFKAISPFPVTTCPCEVLFQFCKPLYVLDINQFSIYQDVFQSASILPGTHFSEFSQKTATGWSLFQNIIMDKVGHEIQIFFSGVWHL